MTERHNNWKLDGPVLTLFSEYGSATERSVRLAKVGEPLREWSATTGLDALDWLRTFVMSAGEGVIARFEVSPRMGLALLLFGEPFYLEQLRRAKERGDRIMYGNFFLDGWCHELVLLRDTRVSIVAYDHAGALVDIC